MGTTKVDIPISQLLYEFLKMVGFMMTVADFPSILWSVRCVVLFLFDMYRFIIIIIHIYVHVHLLLYMLIYGMQLSGSFV